MELFVNRDGLGTRTLVLMTHHIVLHDSVLPATYRGLVALTPFFPFFPGRDFLHSRLSTWFSRFLGRVTASQRPTERKRSHKKTK